MKKLASIVLYAIVFDKSNIGFMYSFVLLLYAAVLLLLVVLHHVFYYNYLCLVVLHLDIHIYFCVSSMSWTT